MSNINFYYFSIINIDIANCYKLVYNKTNLDEVSDLEVWGAIITCEYLKDIESILERGLSMMSKEEKEELLKQVDKASRDEDIQDMISFEKSVEERMNYFAKCAAAEARRETIKEVTKEMNNEHAKEIDNIIKNMLEENLSYEQISKITGKSIEYIKNIG